MKGPAAGPPVPPRSRLPRRLNSIPRGRSFLKASARSRDCGGAPTKVPPTAIGRGQVYDELDRSQYFPAKGYLSWYEGHAETGASVVGSSNMTLAGFSGNTDLNVRV